MDYKKFKKAFGLAEVIIAVLILGIVATLVMPPFIAKMQKIYFTLRLKKIYVKTNEAFRLAMVHDGVNDIGKTKMFRRINGLTTSRTGQGGFSDEITKYFKTTRVYKYAEYKNPIRPIFLNGKGYSIINQNAFTMFLNDGAMIRLIFYKYGEIHCPVSRVKSLGGKLYKKYGAVYIDVNGEKGPNVVGRDYFYFYLGQDGKLYPNNGIDETIQFTCFKWENNFNHWTHYLSCKDEKSYGYGCGARIIEENWKMNY